MATAITLQDIIDAIDAEPEMLDALRARLLTRELIELPEKFAAFQTSMLEFQNESLKFQASMLEFQNESLKFQASMLKFQNESLKFQEETRRNHAENLKFQEETRSQFAEIRGQLVDLGTQVGRLNGWVSSRTGLEEVPFITDGMGYRYRRLLERVELMDMVHDSDTTGIRPGDLDSFKRADAIAETTDRDGRTRYVAIEISFTAQKRDTARAVRNAEFLARFTGVPASAAVAGVQMSDEIRDEVGGGGVFWHELPMSVLQPE